MNKLLEPDVQISLVTEFPEKYKILSSYPKVWKVSITPRVTTNESATIIAAANMRTGNISLENLGKVGNTSNYYVYGVSGTQGFRSILLNDRSKYLDKVIEFR